MIKSNFSKPAPRLKGEALEHYIKTGEVDFSGRDGSEQAVHVEDVVLRLEAANASQGMIERCRAEGSPRSIDQVLAGHQRLREACRGIAERRRLEQSASKAA